MSPSNDSEKMKTEKKFIENEKREKIATIIHTPKEEPKGTILLQHGLFSDKEGSWERRADTFTKKGYRAIRFDRRGYGESSREFIDFNLTTGIQDTLTLLNHLQEKDWKNIGIYGSSFGGLIGIHAAVKNPKIKTLALRAPATYQIHLFEKLEKEVQEKGKIDLEEEMQGAEMDQTFFEELKKYDPEEAAEKLDVPTAIFHGTEDEIVPLEDSEKFYEKINVPKQLHKIPKQGHVFTKTIDQKVVEKAAKWFDENLNDNQDNPY